MSIVTAIVMAVFLFSFSQGKFVGLERLRQFLKARTQEQGFDPRFWLFAVLAAAGANEFIQGCWTYLSTSAAQAMASQINPYLLGLTIPSEWFYYNWLLPEVLAVFAVAAVANRWVKSALGKGILYWTAFAMVASVAAAIAEYLLKYPLSNHALYIPAVLTPALLLLASINYYAKNKNRRFGQRVFENGVSLGHCGLLLIAVTLGIGVANPLSTFIAQGYVVDTVIFAAALWAILHYRSGLKVVDSWWHEVVTVFACVIAVITGYQVGELVESQYQTYFGLSGYAVQWWAGATLPALIAVIALFWRPETPWQTIADAWKAGAMCVFRWAVAYRRMLITLAIIGGGVATVHFGEQVATLRSPQETLYKDGLDHLNTDLKNATSWGGFVHPEEELFQQSLMQFEHQRQAGLIGRLLYGEPDVALASQANLKIGVILLYNAGDDKKLLNEAIMYLKLAIKMNPGIPYAHDLLEHVHGSTAEVNRLALMALAGERDLEMLYKHNPQQRSKQPQKSKEGQGDDGKEQGDQQGQPDQPNDQEAKPNDQNNDKQGQASKNTTLQQNMQDVKNGKANDGI